MFDGDVLDLEMATLATLQHRARTLALVEHPLNVQNFLKIQGKVCRVDCLCKHCPEAQGGLPFAVEAALGTSAPQLLVGGCALDPAANLVEKAILSHRCPAREQDAVFVVDELEPLEQHHNECFAPSLEHLDCDKALPTPAWSVVQAEAEECPESILQFLNTLHGAWHVLPWVHDAICHLPWISLAVHFLKPMNKVVVGAHVELVCLF